MSQPVSDFTHMIPESTAFVPGGGSGSSQPYAFYPASHISAKSDGTPLVEQIPGVTIAVPTGGFQSPAGSWRDGTITIEGSGGLLGGAGTKPSIFRCSEAGLYEPAIEQLPYASAFTTGTGNALICRDFAYRQGAGSRNLRTNATAAVNVAPSGSYLVGNSGQSIVGAPTASGSIASTFAAQGLSVPTVGPTAGDLLISSSTTVPTAHVLTDYDTVVDVPWDFSRHSGPITVRKLSNMSMPSTGWISRYGSLFTVAQIATMEIYQTNVGGTVTSGGVTYQPCNLDVEFGLRLGLLRIYPDGTVAFYPWTDKTYSATWSAWQKSAGVYRKAAAAAWPALPSTIPLTTVQNDTNPGTNAGLIAMPDRLLGIAGGIGVGTVAQMFAYDGTYLGIGSIDGVIDGLQLQEGEYGTTWKWSRDFGATETDFLSLSGSEKFPYPGIWKALKLF